MFRKVFKSLSKALSTKEEEVLAAPTPPSPAAKAPSGKGKSQADDKAKAKAADPAPAPKKAEPVVVAQKTPEELCEITPKMSKDEIKAKLAFLYRRFNRATSSLDPKLRAEADIMLDAVVAIREKVFGPM
jgi:hypothetical protein